METFGDRIKNLRKEKGLTQQSLADLLFITKSSVSKYEHNINIPENELLQKIADIFDVSIDYLLCRTDNKKNSIIEGNYNDNIIKIELEGKEINLTQNEVQDLINKLGEVGFNVEKLINK